MNKILQFSLLIILVNSCANSDSQRATNSIESDFVVDSSIIPSIQENKLAVLPEPFEVAQIANSNRLQFTSGVMSKSEYAPYCDDGDAGLYGTYTLDDAYSKLAEMSTIDIYKSDKSSNWQAADKDQKIWKMHLKTDVISVWDSIQVGLERKKIIEFGRAHNGLCIKKGDSHYLCDFSNFSILYRFKNDTLMEMEITRQCEKN